MRKLAAVLGLGQKAVDEPIVPTPDELRAAERLLLGEAVYALLWQIRIAPDDRTRRAVASTFDGLALTDTSFRDYENVESTDGAILAAAGRVAANRKRDFNYREIEKEIRHPSPGAKSKSASVGSLWTLLESRIDERKRRNANWEDMPVSHDERLALSLATYERLKVAQNIAVPGGSLVVLDNRTIQQAKAMLATAADYGHSMERLDKALDDLPSSQSLTPREKGNRYGAMAAVGVGLSSAMGNSVGETVVKMACAFVYAAVISTWGYERIAQQRTARAADSRKQVVSNRAQLDHQASAIHLPANRERRTFRRGQSRH